MPETKPSPGLSTREKINYSLVGVILLGGAVIVGRTIIKRNQARNEERLTYEDGTAPTLAKQIKMAFDNDGWWGTNVSALRQAIRDVKSKTMFKATIDAYNKLYSRSLMADMKDELKSTEYNEMVAILSAKPEKEGAAAGIVSQEQLTAWAKRLKAAFDITYGPFPGTDEDAIRAVFLEIPSQGIFSQVSDVYASMYGSSLNDDLGHELEFWEIGPFMDIIKSKPA